MALTGFVPAEDKGAFLVNVQLPDASSLSRTRKVMDKVNEIIAADSAVEQVTSITGFSILTGAKAANGGTFFVVLKPWEDRPKRKDLALLRFVE